MMNATKPIWADDKKRIRLPKPAKPNSGWIPAKGRVVKGKDGWLVWKGELVMDPVAALNADRQEDANE